MHGCTTCIFLFSFNFLYTKKIIARCQSVLHCMSIVAVVLACLGRPEVLASLVMQTYRWGGGGGGETKNQKEGLAKNRLRAKGMAKGGGRYGEYIVFGCLAAYNVCARHHHTTCVWYVVMTCQANGTGKRISGSYLSLLPRDTHYFSSIDNNGPVLAIRHSRSVSHQSPVD